ncbi:DUF6950 family protein [Bradyrhizobium prioriisuperbiae]|uniref:DUF6950 family protein n=1 Tax=Bradyrhizobium prioriisuperbiae TaxID=2854389 RepID=UPI0038993FFE
MCEVRSRLEAAILVAMIDAMAHEMKWGRDDCALWVGNIIREACGYDPAADFRGRYKTKIGAKRKMGKGGLAAIGRSCARKHKWRRINEGAEQVGDVGLTDIGGVLVTVICRAAGWYVGRNESGWTAIKASSVRIAWSVI